MQGVFYVNYNTCRINQDITLSNKTLVTFHANINAVHLSDLEFCMPKSK